jgi:hypothetical protein
VAAQTLLHNVINAATGKRGVYADVRPRVYTGAKRAAPEQAGRRAAVEALLERYSGDQASECTAPSSTSPLLPFPTGSRLLPLQPQPGRCRCFTTTHVPSVFFCKPNLP